jgi:hypothetical protein
MELRLALTPRRRRFWVSSSGTGRRTMISFAPATTPSSRPSENRPPPNGGAETRPDCKTTLPNERGAHDRPSLPRSTVPSCAAFQLELEDEAVDPRLRVNDA